MMLDSIKAEVADAKKNGQDEAEAFNRAIKRSQLLYRLYDAPTDAKAE